MTPRSRAVLTVALACMPLALVSGCGTSSGSGEGSKATLQYTPGTSYALKEPATTTTTTTTEPLPVTPGTGTSPTEQRYTVQSGDSLFKIANLYDVDPQVICTYNGWPECIDPPHYFFAGDEVLIPPGASVPGVTADGSVGQPDTIDSATDGASTQPEIGCVHTIVAGDNPTRVANKYGITVDELSRANLDNPVWDTFLIGSTLNIPANGDC